jgi:hypothetical protein
VPPITLRGITGDAWDCLRDRARSMGISFPPSAAGTVNHPEGDADYAWDEAAGTLSVTFTRTPSWISCGDIESRMRHAVGLCGG